MGLLRWYLFFWCLQTFGFKSYPGYVVALMFVGCRIFKRIYVGSIFQLNLNVISGY